MPIIFSTKKLAQSKNTLGNLLKNTRLKYKLKIHHIEQYTNIRKSYIIAIENNEWEQLPDLTYARNFVLTYAKFLELDQTKILNRFDIETKLFKQNSHIELVPQNFWSKFIITPRTITIFTASLITVSIGLYAYFQINYFVQTPQLNIIEPADYTVVAVNKVDIKGQTNPENIIYINNQPLTTDKNGNFSTPIQLKNGYNIIKVTAKNKIGKTTTSTKVVVANIDQIDAPSPAAINLTILATQKDIWIRIKNDSSEVIFEGPIQAGTNQSFTESGNLYITTSDAGATSLKINDQDLGTLGENGQIIEDLQISNQPNSKNI